MGGERRSKSWRPSLDYRVGRAYLLSPLSESRGEPPLALAVTTDRLSRVNSSSHATPPSTVAGGSEPPRESAFVTTHWSAVLAAGRSDTTHAQAALARLCQTYWHPLYAYVRRRGYSPEDAQDLTQEFFARLLEHKIVAAVAPGHGRFRSFLLTSLSHFLSDQWDKARAQKRGAGRLVSLDTQAAEAWLSQQPSEGLTPERAFEMRWVISLLEQVYQRLKTEHERQGKAGLFEALRATLAGPGNAAPYAELAARLGMNEGAVKVAVHRLRGRYRALLREAIAETVDSEAEVEEELRYLFRTLAGS